MEQFAIEKVWDLENGIWLYKLSYLTYEIVFKERDLTPKMMDIYMHKLLERCRQDTHQKLQDDLAKTSPEGVRK